MTMNTLIIALYTAAAGLLTTGAIIWLRRHDRQPVSEPHSPPSPPHPDRACDERCDPIDDAHCGGLWRADTDVLPAAVQLPAVPHQHRPEPADALRPQAHAGATAEYADLLRQVAVMDDCPELAHQPTVGEQAAHDHHDLDPIGRALDEFSTRVWAAIDGFLRDDVTAYRLRGAVGVTGEWQLVPA